VRAAAAEAGRDPSRLRFVVRGVVRLTDDDLTDRRPLHGSAAQITADLEALAGTGVTEVFFDLNWDSETTSADVDPLDALHNAERLLRAFAPQ
jgi:alkanesulfonate monooxygenase SsuD/methylene tetrahydromethanopterin reductase-like flavin-dependent oxidoreductase (luciferase family)